MAVVDLVHPFYMTSATVSYAVHAGWKMAKERDCRLEPYLVEYLR
jgi:hypothetical protein